MKRSIAATLAVLSALTATGCGTTHPGNVAPQSQTTNTETPAEQHDTRLLKALSALEKKSPAERALLAMKAGARLKEENPAVEPSATELAGQAAEELEQAEARGE